MSQFIPVPGHIGTFRDSLQIPNATFWGCLRNSRNTSRFPKLSRIWSGYDFESQRFRAPCQWPLFSFLFLVLQLSLCFGVCLCMCFFLFSKDFKGSAARKSLAFSEILCFFGDKKKVELESASVYPDPPILVFFGFLAFFVFRLFLAFLCVFPLFSKDFRGSAKRKTLAFLGKNPCFFPKKQGFGGLYTETPKRAL